MNILLALILTSLVALICLVVYGYKRVTGVYNDIRAFITPESEGKLSPLAQTTQAVSEVLARTMVAQFKTTFMGLQSAQVRGQKAIEGDIVEDMATQSNPLLGALMSQFPTLRKTLRRNPGLVDQALAFMASKTGSTSQSSGNHNSQIEQIKFKL